MANTQKENYYWIPESLKWTFKIMNSPNCYLLIIILVIVSFLILTLRIPDTQLMSFIKLVLNQSVFLVIFIAIETFTIFLWRTDRENLKAEIKRLSEEKSRYMHSNKKLPKHNPSGAEF